ncbi:MAG: PIG-L family deacetylase [Verrucomicrobiales bacterium]
MPSAIAIMAHPDDIEFVAAGTLALLKRAGWEIHYMNVSAGDCGGAEHDAQRTAEIRLEEARTAAEILGATFHTPIGKDLQIVYEIGLLRRLAAVIREVEPAVVLTHSPQDYMEDHTNASRLAVTAAFAHGMPNFGTQPPREPAGGDVTVYHAMPHGLCDPLRRRVVPGAYVNTTEVHESKRLALAAHKSQKEWLDKSQGMDSYLIALDDMSAEVGKMSGRFKHAEGWRRHLHLGFSAKEQDPLADALGNDYLINQAYEDAIKKGTLPCPEN